MGGSMLDDALGEDDCHRREQCDSDGDEPPVDGTDDSECQGDRTEEPADPGGSNMSPGGVTDRVDPRIQVQFPHSPRTVRRPW